MVSTLAVAAAETLPTAVVPSAWNMAAVLPGRVSMQARLAGLGSQGMPTQHGVLRGHTFHYSTLETPLAPSVRTVKHPSGVDGEARGMTCTLVFGGARSGKSAYAEKLAIESGKEVVYIATARAGDGEMAVRIAHHQRQRPSEWTTVEEPLALAHALQQWCAPGRLVLVDCLTLWLSNLMFADGTEYPDRVPLDMAQWKGETSEATLVPNLHTYRYAHDLLGAFVQSELGQDLLILDGG
eukprot:gene36851-41712_t